MDRRFRGVVLKKMGTRAGVLANEGLICRLIAVRGGACARVKGAELITLEIPPDRWLFRPFSMEVWSAGTRRWLEPGRRESCVESLSAVALTAPARFALRVARACGVRRPRASRFVGSL